MTRLDLDATSWVEVHEGWWSDDPDRLYDELVEVVPFQQGRIFRYERWVDEPRLTMGYRVGNPLPHPGLLEAHQRVQTTTGKRFDTFAVALYRDGRDSVAFHRDRDIRWCEDTVVALLVLGPPRPFRLRPRANRYDHDAPAQGATHEVLPGRGDLLVLGGRVQADWEHSVPKVPGWPHGRISVQWRWTSKRGRPEVGASYRAPRTFSR